MDYCSEIELNLLDYSSLGDNPPKSIDYGCLTMSLTFVNRGDGARLPTAAAAAATTS